MKRIASWLLLAWIVQWVLPGPVLADDKLSGKFSVHTDKENGYSLKIPAEFTTTMKGATTNWQGPIWDGGATTISVNSVLMKGVPQKVLYDTNFKSKKDDKNYTDVVPVSIKGAMAFRCKEALGAKGPGDIHRWHLFVFGNDRFYTCGFTGMVASFKANKLQSTYDQVINSFAMAK